MIALIAGLFRFGDLSSVAVVVAKIFFCCLCRAVPRELSRGTSSMIDGDRFAYKSSLQGLLNSCSFLRITEVSFDGCSMRS